MSISDYLASFRHDIERLDTYGFAESIIFQEELRAGKQAVIKAEIVLVDGNLIFRYDNAVHKPKLDFVNHKHSSAGITNPYVSKDENCLSNEQLKSFLLSNKLLDMARFQPDHPNERYWPGDEKKEK